MKLLEMIRLRNQNLSGTTRINAFLQAHKLKQDSGSILFASAATTKAAQDWYNALIDHVERQENRFTSRIIETAEVYSAGDPSVGIPAACFTLQIYSEPDTLEDREEIREEIGRLYELITGEPVVVQFDFEVNERLQAEEAEDIKLH